MSDKWVSVFVDWLDGMLPIKSDSAEEARAKRYSEFWALPEKKRNKIIRHAKRVLLACGKADIDNDGWMNGPSEDAIIEAILAARAAEEKRK